MAKDIYTAHAHVTGGREHGHGATDDGALEVDLRPPTEGGGTNPEQLFAVGYAACFESALAAVARRQKVDPGEVAIESAVTLQTGENRSYGIAVSLDVTLPDIDDPEQATSLVEGANQVCPYSNATRGNVEVALTANGRPVG